MGIKGSVCGSPQTAFVPALLRKPSIYKEIGPGDRIALSKLAVEAFERQDRPLRLAIDVSIWLFQIQSGKGVYDMPSGATS